MHPFCFVYVTAPDINFRYAPKYAEICQFEALHVVITNSCTSFKIHFSILACMYDVAMLQDKENTH